MSTNYLLMPICYSDKIKSSKLILSLISGDPNFDAVEMGGSSIKLGTYIPELDKDEIDRVLKPLLIEYYENSELEECISAISKFNVGECTMTIII